MRKYCRILVAIFVCFAPLRAYAEKRVALVIGNSNYQHAPTLITPASDSAAIGLQLTNAGFVVTSALDLNVVEMRRVVREFSARTDDSDIALVYAGYGIAVNGTNYLVPVDASLHSAIDVEDETVSVDRLLQVMEPAKRLKLIILDACRDNPFIKTMEHSVATRAVARGLARVEPSSPNTLVAFAAKAGSTGSDGDDKNSPYTAALLRNLPKPGLDVRKAFGFVRDDVMKVTRNRQEPFVYGSLGGDDVALVPAPQQNIPPPDTNANARDDYELALQINVIPAWNAFIAKYPSGFYTGLATAQRDKLIAAKNAAADDARLAVEKKTRDDAKAEERNRIAAQQKVDEEARTAAVLKAAEERARIAAQQKAAEDARIAARKAQEANLKVEKDEREKAAAEAAARVLAEQKAKEAEKARAAAAEAAAAKKYAEAERRSQSADAASVPAHGQIMALQPVYFATNREFKQEPSLQLSSITSLRSMKLKYGLTTVSVPRSHVLGHVERPRFNYFRWQYEPEKDEDHFRIKSLASLARDEFVDRLRSDANSVLLFVHGYDVTFRTQCSRQPRSLMTPISAALFWCFPGRPQVNCSSTTTIVKAPNFPAAISCKSSGSSPRRLATSGSIL